jgi:hypothetical protein
MTTKISSIPAYSTSTKRPSVSATGFHKLVNGQILAVGVTKEHLEGLLRSQDPLAKVSLKKASASVMAAVNPSRFRTISGRLLTDENYKAALKVGAVVASGESVEALLNSATSTFDALRSIDLRAVFIDHDV